METKKILFANIPFDGHFNPLTGIAVHLKDQGHDVRWYSGDVFKDKVAKLGIPYYPFKRALQITQYNLDQVFPERNSIKNQLSRLKFDIKNVFIKRVPEFFEDIVEINRDFDFDILICDSTFGAAPLVKEVLKKKTVLMGIIPLVETSKDLPPGGMGILPSDNFVGKLKQNLLRLFAEKVVFSESTREANKIFTAYGLEPFKGNILDILVKKADLFLQSGIPGFEYKRSDIGKNVHFVGPLLPYNKMGGCKYQIPERYLKYRKTILVTQGTLERNVRKLIIPTLEAFKNTEYLVVVTTGGSDTEELRKKYPFDNILIEDFIPFDQIMPKADVYVTNGGYGGVLLSIKNKLPMVVAGVHEGKIEIADRIEYFRLGINLRTELPAKENIKKAVLSVLENSKYKTNVTLLSREFEVYQPEKLCENFIEKLVKSGVKKVNFEKYSSVA